ncbi:DUF3137 domain-containing protein [Roseovarius salinarum]|uniref:DUF3137 domain-containing protein n=1 Tax=Roseovarius salinarum TaxID=1981892 RepID=UPI000C346344|nr:DUF3137 domain-containing protein [Roseovarius salinarum]
MDFTEKAPIEDGFARVFKDRIAPELDRLENERLTLLSRAKMHAGIPVGIALLVAAFAVWRSDGMEGALVGAIVPVAIGGVVAFLLWRRQAHRWGGEVAEAVMPVVCDFLGDLEYDRDARMRFPLDRIQGLGLIGSFNRSELSDRLEGRYRDTEFELVEAHLKRRTQDHDDDGDNTSRTTNVFDGILIRVGVPEPVPTDILITRDLGGFGNKLSEMLSFGSGRSMPKVAFDHADFEAAFEVYADDPDAARKTMPPAFLDNLLAIGRDEGGDKGLRGMTAGFQRENFYLALDRSGDFLAMGGLTRPVTDIEPDLHRAFEDLALVRRIIDRLHGDAPTV